MKTRVFSIFTIGILLGWMMAPLVSHAAKNKMTVEDYYKMPFSNISVGEPANLNKIPSNIPTLKSGRTVIFYRTTLNKIIMCFPESGKSIELDFPSIEKRLKH